MNCFFEIPDSGPHVLSAFTSTTTSKGIRILAWMALAGTPTSRAVGRVDSSLGKDKQFALSARRLHTTRCCSPTWLRATRPPFCHLLACRAKWRRKSRLVKYRTAPGGRYWYYCSSWFICISCTSLPN